MSPSAFFTVAALARPFSDEYFTQPAPDPVAFGMTTEDDGSRDPLLSDRSWAVSSYTTPTISRGPGIVSVTSIVLV